MPCFSGEGPIIQRLRTLQGFVCYSLRELEIYGILHLTRILPAFWKRICFALVKMSNMLYTWLRNLCDVRQIELVDHSGYAAFAFYMLGFEP